MSRSPYTLSADFIRSFAGPGTLSRSEASQIRSAIAEVLGIDDTEFAQKLAQHSEEHKAEVEQRFMRQLTQWGDLA